MAHYFIFPSKDATIYSHPDRSTMNTGHDEVLELVKEVGSSDPHHHPTRILIQFDNDDINEALSVMGHDNFTSSLSEVKLELISSNANNLVSVHNINVYASSHSWDEGTGKYLNLPTGSNGVSWEYRDDTTTATAWPSQSFGDGGGTGSITASGFDGTNSTYAIKAGGGTWYTGSQFLASQQFLPGASLDTNFDVRNIVHKFSASLNTGASYPIGINNYGFLIKSPDSIEANASASFGEIQYFSSDTHTIYTPKLVFKWDDSSYNLPAGKTPISRSIFLNLYDNQESYNQNDETIFRLHVRDKYPTREFSGTSNYLNAGFFTTSSFYSIRDAHTEREIVPFDDYTKLSADDKGMFFKLYMKGLQPERYYRLLFKHTHNEGTTIYDNDYFFKVVR